MLLHSPPIRPSFSITVTLLKPCLDRNHAVDRPAGPAPTMAIFALGSTAPICVIGLFPSTAEASDSPGGYGRGRPYTQISFHVTKKSVDCPAAFGTDPTG